MTMKITPPEWEAISAYLDGQLAQKERARLEARLQASAELRSALEDLRNTRTLLRSQPRVRAPRNFTLTPQMVGGLAPRRSTPSLFPFMRLASAFAGLVFVLVLVADLFAGAPPVPTASMPQMAEVAMATEEVMLESAPAMKTAPDPAAMSAPGEEPLAAAEAMTESMTMMEAPAQAPAEAADAAEEPTGAGEAAGAEDPADAAEPAAEEPAEAFGVFAAPETVSPEIQGTLPAPPEAAPAIAQAVPEEGAEAAAAGSAEDNQALSDEAMRSGGGQPEAETSLDVPVSETAQGSRFPPLDRQTLRWMEVVLAVLALGFGAAAYFLRRSGGGA